MRKDVIVNGIRIAVDETGTGPIVFLLHGISSTKELMYMIRDRIDDRFMTICYDARGYGESEKVSKYTIQEHAEDLIAMAKCFNKKVSVIGFSMGSYIALMAAEMCPELFSKIILIGTRGTVNKSSIERLLDENGLHPDFVSPVEKEALLQKALFAPMTPKEKRVRSKKYQSPTPMTDEERKTAANAIKNINLISNIEKVSAGVLCLTGEYDRINPPNYGEEVAEKIPNGSFEIIKRAGHMVMMENLDELVQKIVLYLDRN